MFKVLIGYILLVVLVPLLSSLAAILTLPLAVMLSTKNISPYHTAFSTSLITGIFAGSLAWSIFYLLDIEYGWTPVLVLSIAFWLNDYNRIGKAQNVESSVDYLIGDIGGILIASTVILYNLTYGSFLFVAIALVAVFVYYVFVVNGNLRFWAAVKSYPDVALRFFLKNKEWIVVSGNKLFSSEEKKIHRDVGFLDLMSSR